MLQQRKYITNTILPEENTNDLKYGKRMFPENKAECLKLDHCNAGVQGERIGELNINSRKQISYFKTDSTQMKNVLNHCNETEEISYPSKKSLVSYSAFENQEKYFETKLVPDCHGRMSICVGRKNGSATINLNIEDYDLERTYHTWKRIQEKSAPHTRSNLENDRFLTVAEDAQRSDRLPIVKNRNPPVANPDGPFEIEETHLPKQARDNLDRTLTPKVSTAHNIPSKKHVNNYKNTFPISQPHTYPVDDEIRGVKRNVSRWAHSDRVRKILYNYSDDEQNDKYTSDYQQNRTASSNKTVQLKTDESLHSKTNSHLNRQENEQQHRDKHCQNDFYPEQQQYQQYDQNEQNYYCQRQQHQQPQHQPQQYQPQQYDQNEQNYYDQGQQPRYDHNEQNYFNQEQQRNGEQHQDQQYYKHSDEMNRNVDMRYN